MVSQKNHRRVCLWHRMCAACRGAETSVPGLRCPMRHGLRLRRKQNDFSCSRHPHHRRDAGKPFSAPNLRPFFRLMFCKRRHRTVDPFFQKASTKMRGYRATISRSCCGLDGSRFACARSRDLHRAERSGRNPFPFPCMLLLPCVDGYFSNAIPPARRPDHHWIF